MGLKDKSQEAVEEKVVEEKVVEEKVVEEKVVEETAVAKVEATSTAVAVRSAAASIFIAAPHLLEIFDNYQYGSVATIVASNGSHLATVDDEKLDLGKSLEFQAMPPKYMKKVVTGSTDEEAKQFFRISDDGETCNEDGRPLEQWVEEAKDAGFNKTKIKDYADLPIIITACAEEPDMVGEFAMMQLAPSSLRSWRNLEVKSKIKAATKQLEVEPVLGDHEGNGSSVRFKSKAKAASWDGNNYTKFDYSV